MPEVSAQEIMASQGTRLSETAPWESYGSEITERLSPTLEAEIEQYAQNRHDSTSSQNQEELCRQRELNAEVAKEYQFLKPEEYADEGPRVGRVMTHADFINKLRLAGVKCWFREHPQPDKVTLMYQMIGVEEPEVACWVQRGQMPEFSFVRFDDHGVPLNEKRRGWRTCLLQAILKGIISETVAHEHFGKAQGPAAERYNHMLYDWRNKRTE